tara:strand:- start:944 stop:1615 length:672 start_codon:yes stop_codon:yes gene_type:complete
MEKNIQEVFSLIREGDKNAVLQLHVKLRMLMHIDANIGEVSRICYHYDLNDDVREEINSKIIMIIIENILLTDKLNKMKNWTELKWYSKRIAIVLVKEYFKIKKREGEIFESFDSYEFNDDGEMFYQQFEGGVNVDVIDYELEYAKLFKEVSSLISPKCRDLFELVIKGISSDEVLGELNNLGHTVKNKKNLASTKEKCKKKLIKKVREHNNYSEWEDIFKMN